MVRFGKASRDADGITVQWADEQRCCSDSCILIRVAEINDVRDLQIRGVLVQALQASEAAPEEDADGDAAEEAGAGAPAHRILHAIFTECTRVSANKHLQLKPWVMAN